MTRDCELNKSEISEKKSSNMTKPEELKQQTANDTAEDDSSSSRRRHRSTSSKHGHRKSRNRDSSASPVEKRSRHKSRSRSHTRSVDSPERKRKRISSDRHSREVSKSHSYYSSNKKNYMFEREDRGRTNMRSAIPEKRSRSDKSRDRHRGRREYEYSRRSPSPIVNDLDRDLRTVMVVQLAPKTKRRDLCDFFESNAGKVRDIGIITDKAGRSNGVAYVEFYDYEGVSKALSLSDAKFKGVPIKVSLTEAEKNRIFEAQMPTFRKPEKGLYRLCVGNLHYAITEDNLRTVFQPFGPVDFINILRDADTQKSRGFGYVQYKSSTDAKAAYEKMNGFELANNQITIRLMGKDFSNCANVDLDDTEHVGPVVSQAELRAKLARSSDGFDDILQRQVVSQGVMVIPNPNQNIGGYSEEDFRPTIAGLQDKPTRCIVLANLFDPKSERGSEWASEIKNDVQTECSLFGNITHCYVFKESKGQVYVKFMTVAAAQKCVEKMDGRYFASRLVGAYFLDEGAYNKKCPEAYSL